MDEAKRQLQTICAELCSTMKLAYGKTFSFIDKPDQATKMELCFFVMYLIFDGDFFDEAELEFFEEACDYHQDRENWYDMIELGRVDTDEHYLSEPPQIIRFMLELDNVLYELGKDYSCVDTIMAAYRSVGDVFINIRGYPDEKREAKMRAFSDIVREYRREHSRNPRVRKACHKLSQELLKDLAKKRRKETADGGN